MRTVMSALVFGAVVASSTLAFGQGEVDAGGEVTLASETVNGESGGMMMEFSPGDTLKCSFDYYASVGAPLYGPPQSATFYVEIECLDEDNDVVGTTSVEFSVDGDDSDSGTLSLSYIVPGGSTSDVYTFACSIYVWNSSSEEWDYLDETSGEFWEFE